MTAHVERLRVGPVLHLVLHEPARKNALSRPMLSALADELADLDGSVTGVVISGAGDTFSAGADFRELSGTPADASYDDAVAVVTSAITGLPRIVIAALEGPCLGAAADLALACDLRVAAQGSYLHLPATKLGLLYNPAAVDRIRRTLPLDTTRRLLLLGERFDDQAALRAGLVTHLAPRGDAVQRAFELLATTNPVDVPAIAATKALLLAQIAGDYDAAAWQDRRLALLGAPARRNAVESAKRRHTDNENQRNR
jgi:enoyl-CoA hydratase